MSSDKKAGEKRTYRTYDEIMSSTYPPRKMLPEKESKVVRQNHKYHHEKRMGRVAEAETQCETSKVSVRVQTRTVPVCKSVHTQTFSEDIQEDYYGDNESE